MTTSFLRKALLLLAALCVFSGFSVKPAEARFLDKTRFVAHVGIAYFVFHHWVSGPFKVGAFREGAPHRTGSIIKAGAALLFAVHEIKVASKIAHTSKDPLLQRLAGGLDNMGSSFASIGSRFKSGQFNPGDVKDLGNSFGSFDSSAKSGGLVIKDKAVPIPGA